MAPASRGLTYLIATGAFALGMASYVTAGLIPMIQTEFAVSVSVAAQLVTAFTLAYGLGSPLCVALLPAHRQRGGLFVMLALFVVANAASAMATDIVTLMALRVFAGVAAGTYLAIGLVALFGLMCRLPPLPATPTVPVHKKLAILADRRVIGLLSISLLAAIASLGMYTFIAPLVTAHGDPPVAAFLWVWGLGGVLGSFLVGALVDRFQGHTLIFAILLMLGVALIVLPFLIAINLWFALAPIALWGAVGWALQVPQNNELMKARGKHGDGNLAVALNESALYLGSAIGASIGGLTLALNVPVGTLSVGAGCVALLGIAVQLLYLRPRGR